LSLLHKATDLAGGNSRYAVEIAQKLSDQLCTAENRVEELETRITELEAEVKFYRDKSEKAEQWLGKISTEIQERVLGSQN
jgi:predicted  nucleic acid-binding Zn-ribbon protein